MSVQLPPNRPQAIRDLVTSKAAMQWQLNNPGKPLPNFFVLGVRGYYDRTIAPAGNNVGAYDDAFFVVSPRSFTAWNGNTDPSRYGWNPNADNYMARLHVGCWRFIHRMHRQKYWAFGQSENPVTVERIREDGSIAITETGCFGIDLHQGGVNGTSSEGCQTVPPDQWLAFYNKVRFTQNELARSYFDYILIDGPIC